MSHEKISKLEAGFSAEAVDDPEYVRDPTNAIKSPTSRLGNFIGGQSVRESLQRLRLLLHTSAGQDCVLASIEYLAHALHFLIANCRWRITTYAVLGHPKNWWKSSNRRVVPRRLDGFTKQQYPALLNLSSLFSSARHTLRLFGLFYIWTDILKDLQYSSKSSLIDGINIIQVITMTSYQLLENFGHLASNKIISLEAIGAKVKIRKLYIWAARALFLHLILELMKLSKEAWLASAGGRSRMPPDEKDTGSKCGEPDLTVIPENGDTQDWRKRFWASSAWGLLCLYWSCEQTIPLVEDMAGGLSFLADLFTLRDKWIRTAQ
ncbi:hypothetical protein N7533_007505 [Penicillium manginii]|uniref:uncharacterized protein n=1 Tax=Penicillium manginii TaxID=203109 RepID=UPI0025491A6A|nr:uncharacterized protein N7533_007505 [Penicillium manginii]KAJ5750477.1 hypothetical protein N7533_007505 [Penicillium manginii]